MPVAADGDPAGDGTDLRDGSVFTMTNGRGANHVVAFDRRPGGQLVKVGKFATGGTGSGSFEDTANSMILGTARGEAAPNKPHRRRSSVVRDQRAQHDITVFRIRRDHLEMVELEPSRGEKPVSVTVNRGVLYVLHSGEATDDLFDSEGIAIPNCTTGTPSITGFTVTPEDSCRPSPARHDV